MTQDFVNIRILTPEAHFADFPLLPSTMVLLSAGYIWLIFKNIATLKQAVWYASNGKGLTLAKTKQNKPLICCFWGFFSSFFFFCLNTTFQAKNMASLILELDREKCLFQAVMHSITVRELALLKQVVYFSLAENHRVHIVQQSKLGGPERTFMSVASKMVNRPVCECNELLLNLSLEYTLA